MIKGVPLKIRAATDYPGDKVGGPPNWEPQRRFGRLGSGGARRSFRSDFRPLQNPYFQSTRAIAEVENRDGPACLSLDAPQVVTVRG